MSAKHRNASEIADLILRLGRTAYADCASSGLTKAQWIALRYFSRANRFSRNVSGFAEFHGTTRGTASQTIKSLVNKSYLTRRPSDRDRRSVLFDLTPLARSKLNEDPLEDVVRAAARLTEAQQSQTATDLRAVLEELEKARAHDDIGVCRLCGHLQADPRSGNQCRLMRESLASVELEELCMRYQTQT